MLILESGSCIEPYFPALENSDSVLILHFFPHVLNQCCHSWLDDTDYLRSFCKLLIPRLSLPGDSESESSYWALVFLFVF